MNLFIANLSPASTTKDLYNLFSHYGMVKSVNLIIDQVTGKSKRYGFVEMPNIDEAHEAMTELNDTDFQEKFIVVKALLAPDDKGQEDGNHSPRKVLYRSAKKKNLVNEHIVSAINKPRQNVTVKIPRTKGGG